MLPVRPSKTFSADPTWVHNLNLDSPFFFDEQLEHRPDKQKNKHSFEGPFKSKSFRSLHKSNFTETKLLQESTEPNSNLHRQDQTHQRSNASKLLRCQNSGLVTDDKFRGYSNPFVLTLSQVDQFLPANSKQMASQGTLILQNTQR